MRWKNSLPLATAALLLAGCELSVYSHHPEDVDAAPPGPDVCVPLDEICDGYDNDCDGLVDNDDPSVIAIDISNCGQCGNVCDLPNVAIHLCEEGECTIGTCDPGYADLNAEPSDGCESDCVPTLEYDPCDGVDNDCNGVIDDGYDLQTDPNNCGGCGNVCADLYPQADYHVLSFSCQGGGCTIAACEESYYNRDGVLDDGAGNLGCEYNCQIQYTVELCNNVDDDCDGLVDNNPVDEPPCLNQGVCSGVTATCTAGVWDCTYPADYELIEGTAFGCDGQDNDCDGVVDEAYNVGLSCSAGTGACMQLGTLSCNSGGTDSECSAVPGTPGIEVCDGIDNDCDNQVDEVDPTDPNFSQYGSFVYLPSRNITIFAYEASRTSATAGDAGFGDDGVPCSVSGVMPWSGITATDNQAPTDTTARQACQRLGAGWDLCTNTDWEYACDGGTTNAFPYGASYVWNTCNGFEYGDCAGTIGALPTGSMGSCARGGVYDLSGNLKEWVRVGGSYEVRGGAYNNVSNGNCTTHGDDAPGLECTSVSPMPPNTEIHLPSIGFRCCYSGDLFN